MSSSSAERFAAGFVGVPGQRTFFLQFDDAGDQHTYLCEKSQIAGFADYGAQLLSSVGFADSGIELDPGPITVTEDIAFRVGTLNLAYDEPSGLVEVTVVPADSTQVPVLHKVTPAQLDAAVREGGNSISAGRPKCPQCSLAMDPDGHVCPTTNGDLRHHRA